MEGNFKFVVTLISISLAVNGFFITRSYATLDSLSNVQARHSIKIAVIESQLYNGNSMLPITKRKNL